MQSTIATLWRSNVTIRSWTTLSISLHILIFGTSLIMYADNPIFLALMDFLPPTFFPIVMELLDLLAYMIALNGVSFRPIVSFSFMSLEYLLHVNLFLTNSALMLKWNSTQHTTTTYIANCFTVFFNEAHGAFLANYHMYTKI